MLMARASLTTDAIDAFRTRAVAAATELFAAEGFDVARTLGCSPMTPYRYFPGGKDELFAAVRTAAFRRFADAQLAAFEAGGDPAERLRALGRAYVTYALAHPESYRVMFQLQQEAPGRWPELDRASGRAFGVLVRAVEDAIAAGVISGEPLTVAHLLWAQVHGLVTLQLAGRLTAGRAFDDLVNAPPVQWTTPAEPEHGASSP